MDKIREYVEQLWKEAPKEKRSLELKEELIADLQDKYRDLLATNLSDKEAYQEVIASIGDMDSLLVSLKEESSHSLFSIQEQEKRRKKTAFVVSLCVGIYILDLILMMILEEIGASDMSLGVTFFAVGGIATCILIYYFMSIPKYEKQEATLVEEFKEWKDTKSKNRELKKGISSIVWMFIVILYFLISFIWQVWYISWVLFLIGALLDSIVSLVFKIKEG